MFRKYYGSFGFVLTAGFAVLSGGYFYSQGLGQSKTALAAANTVTFPPLDQLVHYTTVRRGVTREHMLTTPQALRAIKAGEPVAVGTHVVLVDYQSDVLHRYLVAQKVGEGSSDQTLGVWTKLTFNYSFEFWDFTASVAPFFGHWLSVFLMPAILTHVFLVMWRRKARRSRLDRAIRGGEVRKG
ncbi:hypothetical protein WGT02_28235 (plasmid) [Rhizobium sp. T1470]|uniref:hypothetical protein n=1 Tax=unclassified Rhizobium TaxID=2613769 RepID=UPI001CD7C655|nr:hypothetical protein [Rhizobium sp. T1473]MCA0805193.1 hypothetical protein [Rhizobium sp. T1473]